MKRNTQICVTDLDTPKLSQILAKLRIENQKNIKFKANNQIIGKGNQILTVLTITV